MKIFGIGLSRTGTTSLTQALTVLGLRARHYFFDLDAIEQLDAATDTPIARAYKQLDRAYPGSRFVLTVRDMDDWIASCRNFFDSPPEPGSDEEQLALDIYGCIGFDEQKFRARYVAHLEGVQEYFANRPSDLLIMNICNGDGYELLCPFIGRPIPSEPFPHYNSIEWARQLRLRAAALAGRTEPG